MDKGGFNNDKEKRQPLLVKAVCGLVKTVCILALIVSLIIIVLPGTAIRSIFDDSDNKNGSSTITNRKALPPGSVNETAYFTENYDFDDPIVILEGLIHFYELTGVQPYVEVITSFNGYYFTDDDVPRNLNVHQNLVAYTRARYSQLFTDESHLLLVFFCEDHYEDYLNYQDYCIVIGSKAKTVIDDEAEKILSDNIESYFDDLGISEEMFSNAFSDTADRIMGVSSPQSDKTVFIILGALALLVLLVWLSRLKKKRKLKEQEDMEMLKKPLEHYGTDTGNEADNP